MPGIDGYERVVGETHVSIARFQMRCRLRMFEGSADDYLVSTVFSATDMKNAGSNQLVC